MPTAITAKSLPQATATGTVVLDLWAPWCGPCQLMRPILADLEQTMPIKVVTQNIDEDKTIAEQYHVLSIPTLIVFQDGQAVEKITGAYPKGKLQAHFAQLLEHTA